MRSSTSVRSNLSGRRGEPHIARHVFLGHALHHIGIIRSVERAAQQAEQSVVEAHYLGRRTVVGVLLGHGAAQFVLAGEVDVLHHMSQQGAVAVAEAVDGLFLVADDEIVVVVDTVGHQRRVAPLHG